MTMHLWQIRVLTIGMSGLIGGPFVAIIVGIVSGLSRLYIGGANAYTYLISSIFIALISGFYGYRTMRRYTYPTVLMGAIIGAINEAIQMACILIFANDTGFCMVACSIYRLTYDFNQ